MTPSKTLLSILIVDDDSGGLETLRDILEINNFTVLTATTGEEGLACAQAELPDLIILDIVLPRMDGYAVIDHLRSDSATRRIPIIAITASVEETRLQRAITAGANAVLERPFSEREVLQSIRDRMEMKSLREEIDSIRQVAIRSLNAPIATLTQQAENLRRDWLTLDEPAKLRSIDRIIAGSRPLARTVAEVVCLTNVEQLAPPRLNGTNGGTAA